MNEHGDMLKVYDVAETHGKLQLMLLQSIILICQSSVQSCRCAGGIETSLVKR
jgi:hypothetical protein